ncbi:hypothetical protein WDU94_014981 [Cyamophila willieti]
MQPQLLLRSNVHCSKHLPPGPLSPLHYPSCFSQHQIFPRCLSPLGVLCYTFLLYHFHLRVSSYFHFNKPKYFRHGVVAYGNQESGCGGGVADPVCGVLVLRHDATQDMGCRNYWTTLVGPSPGHCTHFCQRILLHPMAAGKNFSYFINRFC